MGLYDKEIAEDKARQERADRRSPFMCGENGWPCPKCGGHLFRTEDRAKEGRPDGYGFAPKIYFTRRYTCDDCGTSQAATSQEFTSDVRFDANVDDYTGGGRIRLGWQLGDVAWDGDFIFGGHGPEWKGEKDGNVEGLE